MITSHKFFLFSTLTRLTKCHTQTQYGSQFMILSFVFLTNVIARQSSKSSYDQMQIIFSWVYTEILGSQQLNRWRTIFINLFAILTLLQLLGNFQRNFKITEFSPQKLEPWIHFVASIEAKECPYSVASHHLTKCCNWLTHRNAAIGFKWWFS